MSMPLEGVVKMEEVLVEVQLDHKGEGLFPCLCYFSASSGELWKLVLPQRQDCFFVVESLLASAEVITPRFSQ